MYYLYMCVLHHDHSPSFYSTQSQLQAVPLHILSTPLFIFRKGQASHEYQPTMTQQAEVGTSSPIQRTRGIPVEGRVAKAGNKVKDSPCSHVQNLKQRPNYTTVTSCRWSRSVQCRLPSSVQGNRLQKHPFKFSESLGSSESCVLSIECLQQQELSFSLSLRVDQGQEQPTSPWKSFYYPLHNPEWKFLIQARLLKQDQGCREKIYSEY